MIRFFFNPAPNPLKIALFLEEVALEYELVPIDTRKGEQHTPEFQAINPNGKVPVIVDTDGPGGNSVRVFDSTAILLYLAEKTGRLLGEPADRGELYSWLMFVATGLGPFSGQAVHFQRMEPDLTYAVNRYRRETERHYQVLDRHLAGRSHLVGAGFTIADISAWGWVSRAGFVFGDRNCPLEPYPNIQRWFATIEARPAAERAKKVGSDISFKQEFDEQALRSLFPSNYPLAD